VIKLEFDGGKTMRVLLTSCGLETEEIKEKFLELLKKDMSSVKALFIPTAAIDADAISVLPKCMNDLLKCDIKKENITVYDLYKPMTADEVKQYDVVYICGGNTEYLLNRINEQNFSIALMKYINDNGIVIGVSAGSLIFANNLKDNLNLLKQDLDVHCSENDCEKTGCFDFERKEKIKLGNLQAIVFENNKKYIIG
jgi:peptidase E